jgi:hypothetical protein
VRKCYVNGKGKSDCGDEVTDVYLWKFWKCSEEEEQQLLSCVLENV